MQEPHGEGPASRTDPESCVGSREAVGEALTGESTDQVLSCEITPSRVPTPLCEAEGNTEAGASGEPETDPAQSKTLCMCGRSVHGNREIPQVPAPDGGAGRPGKARSRTPGMDACGKSDGRVVPEKPPNKDAADASAEAVEGRRPTKGSVVQTTADRTQGRAAASSGLHRVREVARRDRRARFTALLHHVTVDLLRESFLALKREAAPGVDGQTWDEYEVDLEARVVDLHERVHRGTYRAQPSRRVYIPKADGRQRPLGIASLEDKIVQQAVVTVLNEIYEVDFLGFSYGYRPGRSQHDALDALWVGLTARKVSWVLDADIQGFFDTIDHGWLLKFVEHRIADGRILRLIRKWLRAGVMEGGRRSRTEMGTPQGAVISPLLANVYLHYVLDLWVEKWRSERAEGDCIIVRYADDFVMGFQHRGEAERFRRELEQRLDEFGLKLHPEKTRLIEFGRFAAERRETRGQGKPETFEFLGFVHACGRTRKNKWFTVTRRTSAVRQRSKLKWLRQQLMLLRHRPPAQVGAWLRRVVVGYFNYYAVPGNGARLDAFRTEVIRAWLHALRRRSQRHRMPWSRFVRFVEEWIPRARILHPYPSERFYAKHPR
jgi:group II intron reverse transcriptase/maturase